MTGDIVIIGDSSEGGSYGGDIAGGKSINNFIQLRLEGKLLGCLGGGAYGSNLGWRVDHFLQAQGRAKE